ncbi:hypothetical protein E2C01_006363 [Portunus trituberculatus]|uniref:Uncharacterized protein n=1 Tax=Portunus trituberculatus TaxID=210409 RepID=A0A5B7D1M4_PORTR|nr:hypothetical protein [Portunus trituberculatus]
MAHSSASSSPYDYLHSQAKAVIYNVNRYFLEEKTNRAPILPVIFGDVAILGSPHGFHVLSAISHCDKYTADKNTNNRKLGVECHQLLQSEGGGLLVFVPLPMLGSGGAGSAKHLLETPHQPIPAHSPQSGI